MLELNIEYFDQIYEIMKEAFPKEERRSSLGQKALFEREDYHVCGYIKDGKVQTFIAYYKLEDFYFIEHLATHHTTRGSGIGRELLLECFEQLDKDVIFEVEKPENDIAKRRIGFYERLGCHLYSAIPYLQPPFYQDVEPLPLYLMSWPTCLEANVVKQKISCIYQNVYHINEKNVF